MSATFRVAEHDNTTLSRALFDRLLTHPLSVVNLGPALMDVYIGQDKNKKRYFGFTVLT